MVDGNIRALAERRSYDAVVVGAGPNGLSAAITLAQAGRSVLVVEANETVGGAARSAELTLPGFVHDLGSAIHPLAAASPFFRDLQLQQHGLEWVHPDAPLAHPLDNGTAVLLERSVQTTAHALDVDRHAYLRLMEPVVESWQAIAPVVQGPLRPPRHPLAAARFGALAARPATMLARQVFEGERARALFAGNAAHSLLSLDAPITSGFGLTLGVLGHVVGWPFPRGGAQQIADALAVCLRGLGGEIITGSRAGRLEDLPPSRAVLCDLGPKGLLQIAGHLLPSRFKRTLERYRYGPGAFKLDWALDGPIPWKAWECRRAGTVHLGGALDEIADGEREVARGGHPERPFVLLAQQSLFDSSRAPDGRHTAWAYCHVPNSSTVDMTARVERQVERFAPGFRDRVLGRAVSTPADLEQMNANLVGGDVNGGMQDLIQLFARPRLRHVPYKTPVPGLYICSASTPPGGGVHGLCGYFAAKAALRYSFGEH